MLYKVTPMLTPVEKPARDPDAQKVPRKRRKSAVYDGEGREVLITMMCLKCRQMRPLGMFGLRKMADGAIRNQPWCRTCRSGASATKKKPDELDEAVDATETVAAPGESDAAVKTVAAPATPLESADSSATPPLAAE